MEGKAMRKFAVRRVDRLGRVVIPIYLRNAMGLGEGESLEMYTEDGKIVLEKFVPSCFFCGNTEELKGFKGKTICIACLNESQKAAE
jgi:transcriptional pleiotropic regulator of transition state genes